MFLIAKFKYGIQELASELVKGAWSIIVILWYVELVINNQ